jgi:hypothetical protein
MVDSAKVRNGSLRPVDFTKAARAAIVRPKDDAGPSGLSGVEIVQSSSPFNSSPARTVSMTRPQRKRVVGGGAGAGVER